MPVTPQSVLDLDVGHITSELSLHELFAAVFRFPGWYGKNFDALWESLTDPDQSTLPSVLVLHSFNILEERMGSRAAILREIFTELPTERPITVSARDSAGVELVRWPAEHPTAAL
jgi:ribonuclease inhibitor